jgi:hypothetical protein
MDGIAPRDLNLAQLILLAIMGALKVGRIESGHEFDRWLNG